MLQVGFLLLLVLAVPLQAQSGGTVPVDAALSFLTPNAAVEFHTGSMNAPAIPIQDGLLRVPSTRGVDPCSASGCAALVLPLAGSLHSQGLLDDGKSDQHIKDDKDDARTPDPTVRNSPSVDLDQHFYYKNKVEFSLDGGWLPVNIPFVFDVFMGDAYNMTSLRYTLVPVIASLRWQMNQVGGPWILRGNWDLECSGAVTFIPRGPETRYFAWIMGVRRNFVPRNGRIAPYFDGRVGLGNIDAKGPAGVLYAQGQDFTFTVNLGSGVRYNLSSSYSISAGLNWMHISNLYLSEPKFANYGINVYGPMLGVNVRLRRPHRHASK